MRKKRETLEGVRFAHDLDAEAVSLSFRLQLAFRSCTARIAIHFAVPLQLVGLTTRCGLSKEISDGTYSPPEIRPCFV
jgi:hypothetical protein